MTVRLPGAEMCKPLAANLNQPAFAGLDTWHAPTTCISLLLVTPAVHEGTASSRGPHSEDSGLQHVGVAAVALLSALWSFARIGIPGAEYHSWQPSSFLGASREAVLCQTGRSLQQADCL